MFVANSGFDDVNAVLAFISHTIRVAIG